MKNKTLYIIAILAIVLLLGVVILNQEPETSFEREVEYTGPNTNAPFNPNIE